MHSSTVRNMLVRGMVAGVVTALPVFALAYLLGEPHVDAAISFEAAHEPAGGGDDPEPVGRGMQSTLGLLTAVGVYGIALGGIAALVFCFALGRLGRLGTRSTALLVALGAFVTVFLVPFVKYPANPPAVGEPDTIGQRTGLYFLMMLLTVLLALAAILLGRRVRARLGVWNATVLAGAAFVVLVGLAVGFLPSVNEVPKDFSASLLWEFRLTSVGMQVLLWTVFGLLFGHLAERVHGTAARRDGVAA